MMRLIRNAALLILPFTFYLLPSAIAQDIHFSQFYETSILRNPALVGVFSGDYRVAAVYRNQWSSISAPFQTGLVSGEWRMPVGKDFFSAGLVAYYDRAGSISLQTLGVYPAVNYNKSLSDGRQSFLSVGFTGGYLQRSFDPSKMTFNTQYQGGIFNATNASGEQITNAKVQNWDLGAGVAFSSTWGENDRGAYFGGISGYHFTQPKRNFTAAEEVRLAMKVSATAGFSYKLNDAFSVQGHAMYTQQGDYTEIIGGGLLGWRRDAPESTEPLLVIYLGSMYRYKDAIIPMVKVDYMRCSFGLSYDVTASTLKTAASGQGGFELTVSKTGLFKDPKHEMSRVVCPKFPW